MGEKSTLCVLALWQMAEMPTLTEHQMTKFTSADLNLHSIFLLTLLDALEIWSGS